MENTSLTGVPREYCNNEAYKYEALEKMIRTEVIPHVGGSGDLLGVARPDASSDQLGADPTDDRDSYICKRSTLPVLPRQLDATVLRQTRQEVRRLHENYFDRGVRMEALNIKSTNIEKIIKSSTIESGLKSALMRPGMGGGLERSDAGVSRAEQDLRHALTYAAYPRISTKNSKLIQPRKLHGTQWEYFVRRRHLKGTMWDS
jgi:hypothetical protein